MMKYLIIIGVIISLSLVGCTAEDEYRVQVHSIVHAMQIGYLRHMLEPDWKLGGQFGDMANSLIGMSYHTTPDLEARGF